MGDKREEAYKNVDELKQNLKQVIAKYEGKEFDAYNFNFVAMANDSLKAIECLESYLQEYRECALHQWQFTKENYANGVPAWIRNSNTPVEFWSQFCGTVIGGVIKTLGGDLSVKEDDWIIQDPTNGKIWVR